MSGVTYPYARREAPTAYDRGYFTTELQNIQRAIQAAEGDTGLINLKGVGATVDGVADDTKFMLNAVTQVAPGGTIFIPGFAKVSATIPINVPDVTIMSWGTWGGVVPADATFNLFTLGPLAHRTRFLNMRFKGAATDDTTAQFGVFTGAFAAPDDVEVWKCFFGNASLVGGSLNSGVKADGGNGWKVIDNRIEYLQGAISNTGYGVLYGTSNKMTSALNYFLGTTGRGRHAVYHSGGCTDCVAALNLVDSFTEEAFPIYSTAGQAANLDNWIIENKIRNGGRLTSGAAAISITGKSSRNGIARNKINGFQGSGVIFTNGGSGAATDANTADDNEIVNTAWHGVLVQGATNTDVTNNKIKDVGQASSGLFSGVAIQMDGATVSDKTSVLGNIARGTTLRSGLVIVESGNTGTVSRGNNFPDGQVAKVITNGAPLDSDDGGFGVPAIGGNNGDSSQTVGVFDSEVWLWASALSANRVATLSTANAWRGCKRKVLRTGLGAFTLDVGPGLKTIPNSTAAFVEVTYSGSAWVLTGYGTL